MFVSLQITNMKWLLVLSALLVLGAAEELYTTENDDLDIEAVVKDPETRKEFNECFTDVGPCRDAAADFKSEYQLIDDLAFVLEWQVAGSIPITLEFYNFFFDSGMAWWEVSYVVDYHPVSKDASSSNLAFRRDAI